MGFRRVYKRRGLHPRELITGIENASKQSTEVQVKIMSAVFSGYSSADKNNFAFTGF